MRIAAIAAALALAVSASAQTTVYGNPNFDAATMWQSGGLPEVLKLTSGDVGYDFGGNASIPFNIDQPATVWLAVYTKDANPQYGGAAFGTGGGPGRALTRAAGLDTMVFISAGQEYSAGNNTFVWNGRDWAGNAVVSGRQYTYYLFALNTEATPTWVGGGFAPWNSTRMDPRTNPPTFWWSNASGDLVTDPDGNQRNSLAVHKNTLGLDFIQNPEGIETFSIPWMNEILQANTDWRDILDVELDPAAANVMYINRYGSIPGIWRVNYDAGAGAITPDESSWPSSDRGFVANEARVFHAALANAFQHPWVADDGLLYYAWMDRADPKTPGVIILDRATGEIVEVMDYSDFYLGEWTNDDGSVSTYTPGPSGIDIDETGIYTSGYWMDAAAVAGKPFDLPSFPMKRTRDGDLVWRNTNGDGFIDRYQGDEASALGINPADQLVNATAKVGRWGISTWGGYNNPQFGIVLGPDGAGLFNINLDKMPGELPGEVYWWDTNSNLDGLYIAIGYGGRFVHWPMDVSKASIGTGLITAVAELAGDGTPDAFALDGNYPNPFNAETTIRFSIPNVGELVPARLVIYNAAGQQVLSLLEGDYGAGQYKVTWDGRDAQGRTVGSGVYTYRLTVGERFTDTAQMTLLK